jgi:hypothetical protein
LHGATELVAAVEDNIGEADTTRLDIAGDDDSGLTELMIIELMILEGIGLELMVIEGAGVELMMLDVGLEETIELDLEELMLELMSELDLLDEITLEEKSELDLDELILEELMELLLGVQMLAVGIAIHPEAKVGPFQRPTR